MHMNVKSVTRNSFPLLSQIDNHLGHEKRKSSGNDLLGFHLTYVFLSTLKPINSNEFGFHYLRML